MTDGRGLDRLVFFIDAVVAIAITVLVLPLLDVVRLGAADQDLASLLAGSRAQFGAFLLSFIVIARAWLFHHRLMQRVGSCDSAFLLLNLTWALTVVLVPFSTQVIAAYRTDRLSVGIYIGTIAANSVCSTGLALLVRYRPALQAPQGQPPRDRRDTAISLIPTGLVVAALVIGVGLPQINFYALLLLTLTLPLSALFRRLPTGSPRHAAGMM